MKKQQHNNTNILQSLPSDILFTIYNLLDVTAEKNLRCTSKWFYLFKTTEEFANLVASKIVASKSAIDSEKYGINNHLQAINSLDNSLIIKILPTEKQNQISEETKKLKNKEIYVRCCRTGLLISIFISMVFGGLMSMVFDTTIEFDDWWRTNSDICSNNLSPAEISKQCASSFTPPLYLSLIFAFSLGMVFNSVLKTLLIVANYIYRRQIVANNLPIYMDTKYNYQKFKILVNSKKIINFSYIPLLVLSAFLYEKLFTSNCFKLDFSNCNVFVTDHDYPNNQTYYGLDPVCAENNYGTAQNCILVFGVFATWSLFLALFSRTLWSNAKTASQYIYKTLPKLSVFSTKTTINNENSRLLDLNTATNIPSYT